MYFLGIHWPVSEFVSAKLEGFNACPSTKLTSANYPPNACWLGHEESPLPTCCVAPLALPEKVWSWAKVVTQVPAATSLLT